MQITGENDMPIAQEILSAPDRAPGVGSVSSGAPDAFALAEDLHIGPCVVSST